MASTLRAVVNEVKRPEVYPFVIGFASVFGLCAAVGGTDQEHYKASINPRFSKPFIREEAAAGSAGGDENTSPRQ